MSKATYPHALFRNHFGLLGIRKAVFYTPRKVSNLLAKNTLIICSILSCIYVEGGSSDDLILTERNKRKKSANNRDVNISSKLVLVEIQSVQGKNNRTYYGWKCMCKAGEKRQDQ